MPHFLAIGVLTQRCSTSTLPIGRLDHRHDAGADRLGQVGPCIHDGGKAWVIE